MIERIEAERESLAEEVAEMDSDDPQRATKAQRGALDARESVGGIPDDSG